MNSIGHNSRRVFAAWMCMFAAICLYAPLGLAAWPGGAACCHGNGCAIPEHHQRRASTDAGHAAQCGHAMTGMPACGMSCCQQMEHAPIASVVYLLPAPLSLVVPVSIAREISALHAGEFLRPLKPLSPPPRT